MNYAYLTSVLIALIGILPALIGILPTILTTFRRNTVGLIKPLSLKVLKIQHEPLSIKSWNKIRRQYLLFMTVGLIGASTFTLIALAYIFFVTIQVG